MNPPEDRGSSSSRHLLHVLDAQLIQLWHLRTQVAAQLSTGARLVADRHAAKRYVAALGHPVGASLTDLLRIDTSDAQTPRGESTAYGGPEARGLVPYVVTVRLREVPDQIETQALVKRGWTVRGGQAQLRVRAEHAGAAGRIALGAMPAYLRHLIHETSAGALVTAIQECEDDQ